MISSNTILYCIYLFGAFTLFYTFQNDMNVFLLTLLLMLGALWCYLYVTEFIDRFDNKIENKLQNLEQLVGGKVDMLTNRLFNRNN